MKRAGLSTMSDLSHRVVFDCNVFAQALINPIGASGKCHDAVRVGRLQLFWSDYVLSEIRNLATKRTPKRFGVTLEIIDELITTLKGTAVIVVAPPLLYEHPLDPKDSHYVNLALACEATIITSSDKHLLNLMNQLTPEGLAFTGRYPQLRILQPWELLGRL